MQVKLSHINPLKTHIAPSNISEKDSLLRRQSHLMRPIIRLYHGHNMPCLRFQILTQQYLPITNTHQIQLPMQLSTQYRIFIQLEHAVDMVLQFYPHGGEEIDRV